MLTVDEKSVLAPKRTHLFHIPKSFTDGNRIHPPFQFLHRRIVEKAVLHVTHYSVNYIFLDNPSRTQNQEK